MEKESRHVTSCDMSTWSGDATARRPGRSFQESEPAAATAGEPAGLSAHAPENPRAAPHLQDATLPLEDGTLRLKDGAPHLEADALRLQDGALPLQDDAPRREEGALRLEDGEIRCSDGAQLFQDGARTLRRAVPLLPDSARHSPDGALLFRMPSRFLRSPCCVCGAACCNCTGCGASWRRRTGMDRRSPSNGRRPRNLRSTTLAAFLALLFLSPGFHNLIPKPPW